MLIKYAYSCTDYNCMNMRCTEHIQPAYSYINILYLECYGTEIRQCGVTYKYGGVSQGYTDTHPTYPILVRYQSYN